MTTKNSKQTIIGLLTVAVIASLAFNAFQFFSGSQKSQQLDKQANELRESEELATELEKQYHEALSDLEEMRGNNEELNAMIDSQKAELKKQKNKISRLIKNKRDLKKAREELANLSAQVDGYLAEINQLKEQNEQLAAANQSLAADKQMLTTHLDSQRVVNEELVTAKAALVSEKDKLSEKNLNLFKTVTFASVVKVKDVEAMGMKTRSNGKTTKKSRAKKVDHLKICFKTTVNEVTNPGVEKFYIRVINPVGETMAIEELGAGVFINSKSKEEVRYTQMKEYEYAQDETEHCFTWKPNIAFQKGKYQVEIYNKGYIAGSTTFTLK